MMENREVLMRKAQIAAEQLYQGRNHAKLTVGILENGSIETVCFDERRVITEESPVYPVGSINKLFTASLIAKQISEGKCNLRASMREYLPELPRRYYPDLLRLLTHHSGYGGAPFSFLETLIRLTRMNKEDGLLHVNPFRGYPDEKAMFELIEKISLKDRDYKFAYSNLGYGILGYIAGRLEGSDYFTAMSRYFSELGLEHTSLSNSDFVGYDKKGNPCQPWQWENTDIIAPAGAMLSTAEDLLTFASMNMNGSLPYTDVMFRKYAEGEKGFDQGLAWRFRKNSDICYHVGSAGAFSCILAMDRCRERAVFIGLNYALVDIEELAFSLLED